MNILFTLLLTFTILNSTSFASENIGFSTVRVIQNEDFEDVNDELLTQISNQGMVISYTSHANKMLTRTAPAIDPDYNTYNNALIHLFCSADLAHKMTKSSPHALTGCPYGISIYELTTEPNNIYISYQNSSQKDYDDVILLLEDISSSLYEEYN